MEKDVIDVKNSGHCYFLILNSFTLVVRLLEEGNIDGAEEQKQRIEQLQRERRRVLQENNMTHKPRFFKYAATCLLFDIQLLLLGLMQ